MKRLLFVCGAIAVGCGSGDRRESPSELAMTAPLVTREVVAEIDFPVGRSLSEVAVLGAELQMDNGAELTTPAGKHGGVAHTGGDAARIGRDVQLGTVLSVGDVSVSDGVHVFGDLRTGGIVSSAKYTVDGVTAVRAAIPLRKLARRAAFGLNAPAIRVAPHDNAAIAPGAYAAVEARPGSEVVLRAGNYSFEELTVGPGAKLTIDDRDGAVFVYAGKELNLHGAITPKARLLINYLGSRPVILSRPFHGGLIAPHAAIEITRTSEPHQGAFYGKRVHVHANARIVHRPMPWVIGTVTFDKPSACAGDTVHIKVDPALSGASVAIGGVPVAEMYDQIVGAPGQKVYAVSATAADGTLESQLVRFPVTACASGQPVRPTLVAQAHPFIPDAVALTVANAPTLGDATYEWSFGDGTTSSGTSPAVTHSFADAVPSGSQYGAFDVTVTVKKPGAPDASATRTFVVWSSYEMSRARGMLEPPSAPVDRLLKASGGEIELTNREPEVLTYDRRRIDLIPCDGDAPIAFGGDESIAVAVPAKGSVRVPIKVASFGDAYCSVAVHHFGTTSSGLKAHVSVQLDRPSKPGSGALVDPKSAAVLNYLVKNGLIPAGKRVSAAEVLELYRARKIPDTAATATAMSGEASIDRTPCDPDDPGPPPMPGFACQPTGKWEGAEDKSLALKDRIANAFKGDTVLVRGCGGMLPEILGGTNPPQLFTHTGIMSKHRTEIAHSTASDDYLIKVRHNGTADQPTNGFKEDGLRYGWPGTLVASVQEAFITGRLLATPEGKQWGVSNFGREEVRCGGDAQIVYPRVLKPTPGYEAATRAKLMAAADAAKNIHGHYRFSVYSKAPATPDPEPKAPGPVANPGSPLGPSYGPVPTVCSSFIAFGLQAAGFTLDRDKSFPITSDVRSDTPDGLFFYDVDERKRAANNLYANLYDKVERGLAELGAETDRYWWAAASDIASGKTPEFNALAVAMLAIGPAGAGNVDTIVKWATDAPDDVANQVTNCFASDYCSEDAKDSDRWNEPGTGVAVSPDDMLNHYDSPATGGPYGYSERMIYRGLDLRPVYEWRPIEGTIAIPVRVVNTDGKPADFAQVDIPGFLTTPVVTNADGTVLIEGVPRGNLRIHAQKYFASPAPGQLREAENCYVAPKDGNSFTLVDCTDYTKVLDATPQTEALLRLKNPRENWRKVIISAKPRLEDCDCLSDNDIATFSLLEVCNVNPVERTQNVSLGTNEMCDDEIGLHFGAHCELEKDDRTVHITGAFTLYEGSAKTCGGKEIEDQKKFDLRVGPGVITKPAISTLYHWDVCGLSSCNDTAEIREFTISNVVGD